MISSDGKSAEVSRPSTIFVLYLTDTDEMHRDIRRFVVIPFVGFRSRDEDFISISEMFRIYTAKVLVPMEGGHNLSSAKLHEIAEAAIFHIAYTKGFSVSFTKSWERSFYWMGQKEGEDPQFPMQYYISELVSYYGMALASESIVLSYLALYKILEYFYTSASENELHKKIREHLVAPGFSHAKPKKLRELVQEIRKLDNKLDEATMLKLVLQTYFDKQAIVDWIAEYENKSDVYFTKEVEVFRIKLKIDLNPDHLIPNLAKRIYSIRNALVHHKEGEVSRFVPYTGQEEVLYKEIQILLYLSEQIIIKTGRDI